MEQALNRLTKRHGLLAVLEAIAAICSDKGAAYGEAGKRCYYRRIEEASYSEAAPWYRAARELRRALGALRR